MRSYHLLYEIWQASCVAFGALGGTIGNTVYDITKITPAHDPFEDRLRLNLQTQQGPVVTLWLTQRIANGTVAALAKWLDQEVKQQAMAHGGGGGATATHLQQFEQGAAVARHHAQPAVPAQAAKDQGLIERVDLNRRGERYQITWVPRQGDACRLSLDETQLRQLLEIFRRLYVKAQWSLQGWPAWLAQAPEATPVAAAVKSGALH